MIIKHLKPEDVTRDVLNVLDVLSPTKALSVSEAKKIVQYQIDHNCYTFVGYVDDRPVAMGSVVFILRLGNNGGYVSHVEDVVVKANYQGKGYGKTIIEYLNDVSENNGAYKAILECKDELELFYKKCGYQKAGIFMRKDFD